MKYSPWFGVFIITCVPAPAPCGEMKYLHGVAATFAEAVILCDGENMTLATIENGTEHCRAIDVIQSEIATEGSGDERDRKLSDKKRSVYGILNRKLLARGIETPNTDIWIGLVYNATGATFYWISDGSEATQFYWYSEGEPNFGNGSRTHVIMSPDHNYQYKTADDSDQFDVLCEKLDVIAETTLPSSASPITPPSTGKADAQKTSDDGNDSTWIIVGSTVAGGVILVSTAVAVYCCLKKPLAGVKKRRSVEKEKEGNAVQHVQGGVTVGHYDI